MLLHACCAPCSSAIVEWLVQHGILPTIFYYNPNIWPREEYDIRKNESKRHAERLGLQWIDGDYDHDGWRQGVCGLEGEPERGRRCEQCFTLRLIETAKKAQQLGIRYFATTLASSRWKSLEQIERAGHRAEQVVNGSVGGDTSALTVTFWAQNWRKGGLQERRNQLLKEYGFYNLQYCGCEFSARQGAALTKPLLRQQMRAAKRQYAGQLSEWSTAIVQRLQARLAPCLLPSASQHTVLAYWPLPDEVDIRPLLDQLVTCGATVLLPRVTGDETMELCCYTSRHDMKKGAFHILEPTGPLFTDLSCIDVALVPGVAFDTTGRRLGRGRGYYDRFLATLRPPGTSHCSPLFIGVCFPFQCVAAVPAEAHDVIMDEVLK